MSGVLKSYCRVLKSYCRVISLRLPRALQHDFSAPQHIIITYLPLPLAPPPATVFITKGPRPKEMNNGVFRYSFSFGRGPFGFLSMLEEMAATRIQSGHGMTGMVLGNMELPEIDFVRMTWDDLG
jgi:hypothetical protein